MLDPKYQDRLDKWKSKTLPVPPAEKLRGQKPNSYVARRDYGDDYTEKELALIKQNLTKART